METEYEIYSASLEPKIIIRSFDSTGVLLKQSLNLYIHHKQVYENRDGELIVVGEDDGVQGRLGEFVKDGFAKFDADFLVKNFKNSDTEE